MKILKLKIPKIFLAFLLLILSQQVAAQNRPLLFKVVPPNADMPISYMLASQHWDVGISDLPSSALSHFDNAQVHAFEIEFRHQFLSLKKFLANPNNYELLLKVSPQLASAPRNNYSETQIAQLVALGIPETLAKIIRDENCSGFEQFRYFSTRTELHSLDAELELRAASRDFSIMALEDEDIRKKADQFASKQDYSRKCTITEYLSSSDKIKELDAYLNRIRSEYLATSPESILTGPEIVDPSVVFRNHIWIEKLLPLMQTKSVFVTVGMGHFSGSQGLIQLLRNQKFKVEPVQ